MKDSNQKKETVKKPTVGKVASELFQSESAIASINPQDIQRATEQEYLDNLIWCLNHALKRVDCSNIKGHEDCKNTTALDGDFYISVLVKKEPLLENVLRNYFLATKCCPTPYYDQTVYRYDSKKESLEFMWVIPDIETSLTFKENKDIIVPSEQGLLRNILAFYDGTLLQWCKKLNGETIYAGNALIGKEAWH